MTDIQRVKVRQTFEKLVNNDLCLKGWHFTSWIAFDSLEQIFFIEPHNDVQILMISLLSNVVSKNFTNKLIFH